MGGLKVVVSLLVVGVVAVLGYVLTPQIGNLGEGRVSAAAFQPTPTSISLTSTPASTMTPTPGASRSNRAIGTPIAIARATLPPVFTSTMIPPSTRVVAIVPTVVPPGANGLALTTVPTVAPTARPAPSSTPTPTSTRTSTPTPTPTPLYDFVVSELKEIPQPQYRDVAYIRGKLVDANGNLIKGAYFEIRTDAIPLPWTAAYPFGSIPADGTAVFPVSKGTFSVRVVGGRSEYAGWMVTGRTGVGPMSDWEFTFVTTSSNVPLAIPSSTSTSTPQPVFTSTPLPTPTIVAVRVG